MNVAGLKQLVGELAGKGKDAYSSAKRAAQYAMDPSTAQVVDGVMQTPSAADVVGMASQRAGQAIGGAAQDAGQYLKNSVNTAAMTGAGVAAGGAGLMAGSAMGQGAAEQQMMEMQAQEEAMKQQQVLQALMGQRKVGEDGMPMISASTIKRELGNVYGANNVPDLPIEALQQIASQVGAAIQV